MPICKLCFDLVVPRHGRRDKKLRTTHPGRPATVSHDQAPLQRPENREGQRLSNFANLRTLDRSSMSVHFPSVVARSDRVPPQPSTVQYLSLTLVHGDAIRFDVESHINSPSPSGEQSHPGGNEKRLRDFASEPSIRIRPQLRTNPCQGGRSPSIQRAGPP